MPQPADAVATGRFIVFEGGEGGGKSTQVQRLAERLNGAGRTCVVTREPGGTPRAEAIRTLILADADQQLDARAEALLFAAARADHATHLIRPALLRGEVVISDRYLDSSVAYQGIARGLGGERISDLSLWATNHLIPDLTILLDIDPAVGLARALDPNRLEAEPLEFHQIVRRAFLDLAAANPERYRVVDAAQSADEVHAQVWAGVGEVMGVPA